MAGGSRAAAANGKSVALAVLRLFSCALISCLLAARLAMASDCNPQSARQLLSVAIANNGGEELRDYPVAITLDASNFTFDQWHGDGREIGLWNAATRRPLQFWLESFDAVAGKALLWAKISRLPAQRTVQIWVTAGRIERCAALPGNGYSVFPFFSDAHDLRNWSRDSSLSLSDDVTVGPLHVEDRRIIESDGNYNSTPSIARAANGDWVLSYLKGTNHVDVHTIVLRRSQDRGRTWSPEVALFDTAKPDPSLARMPDGGLFISFVKADTTGATGAAYSLSGDNGLTWDAFTFLDHPVANTFAFTSLLRLPQGVMSGATYGPTADPAIDVPALWVSYDDGVNWAKRSELAQPGDPGTNETAIIRTGARSLLSISRTDSQTDTYGRRSNDVGLTWGSLVSYRDQIGVVEFPQLIHAGNALLLLGRQDLEISGKLGATGSPRQLVAYVSYDEGRTFTHGTVLDTYTGFAIDGAYCWPLRMEDGRIFVVYYADSHGLHQPDIKSLILRVDEPSKRETESMHVRTELAASQATRASNFGLQRYSLDFRFRSRLTPAGSQFSVALSGPGDLGATDLVRWELPSTHADDPTAISGFIAGGQFVPLLTSFSYGQSYRVRTIVDEAQGTEEPQILDLFGQVTADAPAQAFAQDMTIHPSILTIGNNSTLRATDTLVDFIFIRPVAAAEPVISITRVR